MLHIGVHYIDFFTEGQCLAVRWNRGTTYVDSVLHIGVQQKGQCLAVRWNRGGSVNVSAYAVV